MTSKYNPPISFRADPFSERYINDIREYLEETGAWHGIPGRKVTQTDVIRFALYEAFMKVNREIEEDIREAQAPN